MHSHERYRVGIDIGGTFTDLVLIEDETGEQAVGKILTTPDDPSEAVEKGLVELLEREGIGAGQLGTIIHGTTLVTNALIERRGAKTALLTTEGFRDAIAIGNEHRYDMYDIFLEKPEPLVPRSLRYGVRERSLDDGSVMVELDEGQVRSIVAELKEREVGAVAVSFLHGFRNPAHEQRVAEIFAEEAPEITVSLSSEVAPEIREYERTSTTVCNVYVRPLVERYLHRLEERLRKLRFEGSLYIMLSNGGTASVETASRFPIRLLESGPAAGALAAAFYGRESGFPEVLSFDMGGTTAKSCVVENGEPLTSNEFEVARVYRFKKGSGLPVKTSVIEMIEVGAGGGSIAHVDALGLLKVGPDSAGAEPGPVCYGLGGSEPTVTDADLILGYLDPDFFLGGRMELDREGASRAIEQKIARQLGLETVETAWGIYQVVNENMANAARVHAVERGKDPRAYPLFAFGGAGPVHGYRVARALGVPGFIAPLGAGATSAFGFLCAPLAFDFRRSLYGRLDELDWSEVNRALEEMEGEGRDLLRASGVGDAEIQVRRLGEMRYAGQGHEVTVELPEGELGPDDADRLITLYHEEYRRLYGREGPDVPLETLTWRLEVVSPRPQIRLDARKDNSRALSEAHKGKREIYLPEHEDFRNVPVYDRYRLDPGAAFEGPAVVEERESTVVLGPDTEVEIDPARNLIVRW
ncbi:N-methylhydantoinase A [uncultured Rubrobacteraceae bacterium]|uniref:N-methylhydantoinase A n=1 Tax=uncultured Rubrobacteraceae bacterium TaxID=349277 RepID=A0A6J4Q3S8_9ACTN|nr:N-methylhydantoinase A [uncultured Rubrobacteraceae bacterium]